MGGLLDKVRAAKPGFVPVLRPAQSRAIASLRERMSAGSIEWSPDFERVVSLPRRPKPDLDVLARDLTARLKRPEGTMELRPIQAWALAEGAAVGGLIAPLRVGEGKTLLGALMPMIMPNCERAVLLLPPSLRPQFDAMWIEYGKHWKLPNLAGGSGGFIPGRPVLHVVSYSELSHKKGTDFLDRVNADLTMADECQALRNVESSRGGRFFDFFPSRPWARFCAWSASVTAASFCDFPHLFAIALGSGSPCPIESRVVKEWASCLDPDVDIALEPGVLMKFCMPDEGVRSGIRRRLNDTIGIVASGENELKVPLVFRKRTPPPMPTAVREAYRKLKVKDPKTGTWPRPDGEPLTDQLEVQACARSLSVGLYLRWIFPRGEPKELIDTWYAVRAAWNRELRTQLTGGRTMYMDSPALCEDAAKRYYDGGCIDCVRGPKEPHTAACTQARYLPLWDPYSYPAWREIENLVYHESETVWMDDWIARDAAAWAKEHIGIVWTEHPQLGERIAELAGVPYYGAGDDAHRDILKETGDRSIVASIDSQSEGKNFQCFNKNFIIQFPSSAQQVEQTTGRSHRSGQKATEVSVWYLDHTIELSHAREKAMERARFIAEIHGTAQKLNYATWSES